MWGRPLSIPLDLADDGPPGGEYVFELEEVEDFDGSIFLWVTGEPPLSRVVALCLVEGTARPSAWSAARVNTAFQDGLFPPKAVLA